jgi:hypothetical protein
MIVSSNRSLLRKTLNSSHENGSPDITRDELHDSSVEIEIGHLQTLKSAEATHLENCNCKSPPSSIGKGSRLESTKSKW